MFLQMDTISGCFISNPVDKLVIGVQLYLSVCISEFNADTFEIIFVHSDLNIYGWNKNNWCACICFDLFQYIDGIKKKSQDGQLGLYNFGLFILQPCGSY